MRRALTRKNRQWVISTLLIALLVRALIPAGFMPATDRPFSFEICPDGYPAHLLQSAQAPHASHHHHPDANSISGGGGNTDLNAGATHSHSSAKAEHCVFAAAANAGAHAFAPAFSAIAINLVAPEFFYASPAIDSQRFRIQQPRGPPTFS